MKKCKKILALGLSMVMLFSTTVINVSANDERSVELFHNVRNEVGNLSEDMLKLSNERLNDYQKLVRILGINDCNGFQLATESGSVDEKESEIRRILNKHGNRVDVDKIVSAVNLNSRAVGDYDSIHWWLPVEAQQTSYYCGPASVAMVLKAQGYSNVTQSGLASIMGTNSNGTILGNIPTGLNQYSNHTYTYLYGPNHSTSTWPVTMTDAAIGSLFSGWGVVYNTIQYKNQSARLIGYSNITKDIYHYVAGEGFDATDPSNRVCNYVDPNNITYNGYGRHDIAFRTMGTLCKDRGLVY